MRSEDQIKRMIIQLKQMASKLDPIKNKEESNELQGKIEILEWVLDAPTEKYHN